jgi:hypothetical protein
MRTDVVAMKTFYASHLGEVASRQIARVVAELWPDLSGQTVVGIGYPPPLLEAIAGSAGAERVVALMPAAQGAWPWPSSAPGLTALVDEGNVPLGDRVADRIVLIHALEDADAVQLFLREIWRVLSDSGRLLAIAANRRGLWSRSDAGPFGHGRPYSSNQLRQTLEAAMFAVEQETHALYAPPSRRGLSIWSADAAERFGRRWTPVFGGVVAIDASKSLYGAAPTVGASVGVRAVTDMASVATDVSKAKARRRHCKSD